MAEVGKEVNIDKEVRENIGRLMVMMLASPNPAMRIQITAGVIGAIQGALEVTLRARKKEALPDLFGQILFNMNEQVIRGNLVKEDELREKLGPLNEKIFALYHSDNGDQIEDDLGIERDIQRLRVAMCEWDRANSTYIETQTSWVQASAILARIFPVVFGIAIQHKLIALPAQIGADIADLLKMAPQDERPPPRFMGPDEGGPQYG